MKKTTSFISNRGLSLSLFFAFNCILPNLVVAVDKPTPLISASRAPEKDCAWLKIESEDPKMSLLTQNCDFGFRKITNVFEDHALIQKFSDSTDPAEGEKIIEFFKKDPSTSPADALTKLFIAKLNPYEQKHCVAKETRSKYILESPFRDHRKSAWVIEPDKEYAAKIKKETLKDDMPAESCGEYGLPVDSRAYFEFHSNNNETFAWIIVGQDTPLFDEQSINF